MSGKYILVHGEPVLEPDLLKWSRWLAGNDKDRIVEQTKLGTIKVSTVFVGWDRSFGDGPPLLYETMVFGSDDNREEMECYSTRKEAEAGHRQMVERVKAGFKSSGERAYIR